MTAVELDQICLKIGVLFAMIKFFIQKCDDITGRYAMVFLVAVR